MVLIQRTTDAVHLYAARRIRTHIQFVPYPVFVFIRTVGTPADRETERYIHHLCLIRHHVLGCTVDIDSGIIGRNIVHRQRHVDSVVRHDTESGTDIAVFTVIEQRIGSRDIEPTNGAEREAEGNFLIEACLVESGGGNDTESDAVVPEISVQTYVEACGDHLGIAASGRPHPNGLGQILQVVERGIQYHLRREFTLSVAITGIRIINHTSSLIHRINCSGI